MASSWGSSWGLSWGNSWGGAAVTPVVEVRQPGGWLPKKYVRDGKIYDRPDYEPPQNDPEILPPLPIPADLVNALRYGPVFDPFPALQQEIRLLKQQARHWETEMQAEDDLVTVLLLSS